MKNTTAIFLMMIAGIYIACQPPTPEAAEVDLQAVKAEIQALEDGYAKAANEKNVEGILAYYADDAERLAPEKPTIKGKAAIKAQLEQEFATDTMSVTESFKVVDIFADGDLVVEVGEYNGAAKNGETFTGKYIAVFEKRDGKYICVRDIWNSNTDDDDDDDGDED